MEYVNLGRTGVQVSRICLGTAFRANLDEATCTRVIHRSLELGCNFIDCANSYGGGRSEEILGKAIKGRRDDLVITTKVWSPMGDGPNDRGLSRYHILREIERSLTRLQTDHVDLYFLHSVDPATPCEETLRAMEDLVRQGKVRYVGASNYSAWQVVELLWTASRHDWQQVSCLQSRYNLLCRNDIEGHVMPVCESHGLGLVTYSPLAVGLLTGRYRSGRELPEGAAWTRQRLDSELTPHRDAAVEQLAALAQERGVACSTLALAWLLSHSALTAPIIGPDLPQHVDDAMAAVDLELSAEERQLLDRATSWTDYGLHA
jgi:aryl-alcohol dehydrogenase-like predicted oxidoreductase